MAKFRAGVAPLRLETGRYDNTDEADRVCFQCADIIESEEHVILHCPLYDDVRKVIFDQAENVNPDFINMISEEKLIFLLSNTNITTVLYVPNPYVIFYQEGGPYRMKIINIIMGMHPKGTLLHSKFLSALFKQMSEGPHFWLLQFGSL